MVVSCFADEEVEALRSFVVVAKAEWNEKEACFSCWMRCPDADHPGLLLGAPDLRARPLGREEAECKGKGAQSCHCTQTSLVGRRSWDNGGLPADAWDKHSPGPWPEGWDHSSLVEPGACAGGRKGHGLVPCGRKNISIGVRFYWGVMLRAALWLQPSGWNLLALNWYLLLCPWLGFGG